MTALLALYLAVVAIPAAAPLEPVEVWATAYSCDAESPMFPCNTTRWGNDPLLPGIACPIAWAHQKLYIPRIGERSCDDTGKWEFLTVDGYTRPHVDLRLATYDEAIRFGIREIVVYRWELPRWGQERKGV